MPNKNSNDIFCASNGERQGNGGRETALDTQPEEETKTWKYNEIEADKQAGK